MGNFTHHLKEQQAEVKGEFEEANHQWTGKKERNQGEKIFNRKSLTDCPIGNSYLALAHFLLSTFFCSYT
jgi:hypothetical protein